MIRVKKLGKRYRIGVRHTLRESLADAVARLSRRCWSDGAGQVQHHADSFWALRHVSFEVNRGEMIGVVGRNGAGKTTLLKILSRITEPTEGEAEINGRVGSLLEVGTGFHPDLTGRENIYLNGAILGMKRAEIAAKFDEIVAFAEVEKFIDTPVKHYSTGMYMRLAFSVAAHLDPEILLVDEVLTVGDLAFQQKCMGKLGEVAGRGRTVLFVSHNVGAVRSMCGRAVWLHDGQLVKSGSADDVVGEYIETQIGLTGISTFVSERTSEGSKGSSFYISHIEMRNEKGKNTALFEYNDTLVLVATVRGEPSMKEYGISFYIYNEFGHLVSVGSSGAYHGVYFPRDTRKIKIEVGPLVLTSGHYAISLVIYYGEGPAVIRADTWDSACSFAIHSQPFRPGRDISSSKEGVFIIPQKFSAMAE